MKPKKKIFKTFAQLQAAITKADKANKRYESYSNPKTGEYWLIELPKKGGS